MRHASAPVGWTMRPDSISGGMAIKTFLHSQRMVNKMCLCSRGTYLRSWGTGNKTCLCSWGIANEKCLHSQRMADEMCPYSPETSNETFLGKFVFGLLMLAMNQMVIQNNFPIVKKSSESKNCPLDCSQKIFPFGGFFLQQSKLVINNLLMSVKTITAMKSWDIYLNAISKE